MTLRLATLHRTLPVLLFAVILTGVTQAYAAMPAPHVATSIDTDVCAMCHRTHQSASDAWVEDPLGLGQRNALLAVPSSVGEGDTGMCYSCHGVEMLGSGSDVQSSFDASSGHSIAPSSSAFGPAVKQCSTCHDSHGGDKVVGTTPYPALLRSVTSEGVKALSGDAFCATCHGDRTQDRFDGLAAWQATKHSQLITAPASGTAIKCSVCHEPHGSRIAPSILTSLTPPSVPATTDVAANDRRFCISCHGTPSAAWSGETTYATSSHAASNATVTIAGEWPIRDLPSAEQSRTVGQCQNCHAPMGSADSTGGVVPKMLERAGRALCEECHDFDGPAQTDSSELAYSASRVDTEVVAVWRPSIETSIYGDVAVYTRDAAAAVPAALDGPRVYPPSERTGDAAAGDLDGDGTNELVVAHPAAAQVDVYVSDPLRGLKRRTLSVPGGAEGHVIALADLIAHGSGPHGAQDSRPELVLGVRSAVPPHTSTVRVFTYTGSALQQVGAAITVGNDVSSLATGDVTGTARADLIVTAAGSDQFRILTESAGELSTVIGPFATRSKPRGASVGDIWAGSPGNEIVVCNSGEIVDTVSVFSANGALLAHYNTLGIGTASSVYDSVIADLLPGSTPSGTNGLEVAVALRTDAATSTLDATSSVNVFRQADSPASGLVESSRLEYSTGYRYESSSLSAGDVDGDNRPDLVVGNAGKWARFGAAKPASMQVFSAGAGAAFGAPVTFWSTGVEQASGVLDGAGVLGAAPSIVVADLGPIGPSRHPIDGGSGSHVSTETQPVSRHVTCADCHNVHETTATVETTAPAMYGAMRGAYGTAVTNTGVGSSIDYAQKTRATREYEVCLKCHSAYSTLSGTRNIAAEVNTRNASNHAVEAASANASVPVGTFASITPGTFVNSRTSWSSNSTVYCVDCHGNSDDSQMDGPHTSQRGSLLRAPYFGVLSSRSDLLCYLCHKYNVYYTGTEDTGASSSLFRHPPRTSEPRMHKLHSNDGQYSCRTCHVGHGSSLLFHLQNADHGYEHTEFGGACTTACHINGARRAYTRGTVTAPSTVTVPISNGTTNNNLAAITSREGTSLRVDEINGVGLPSDDSAATVVNYDVRFGFTTSAMPSGIEFYGRYNGTPGHTVSVQAYNFNTLQWVQIGTWATSNVSSTYTFPLANAAFRSGTGEVRVRVMHLSPGNQNDYHLFDSVWLNP